MPLNLITDPWFRIRRVGPDSKAELIAPWQLTEAIDTDPVTALNTPRPDFNGALAQFLIGLLQTTFAPADAAEWFEHFESPPRPETLKAAFEPYAQAFDLDGDGPRFMQDQDPLADLKPLPITALLIDTAGSETHFVKDLPTQGLSPAMAALALYALQTNAPSGGVGHRTSLRGGGPLTTLVVAAPDQDDAQPTLWQTLWLNVLNSEHLGYRAEPGDAERIFPWLVSTRTSEKGRSPTTPEQTHPLQAFWGMPRRIRLDLEGPRPGVCAIDGTPHQALIARYRTKNYGTNYGGAWRHPLTPYTHDGKELLAVHPRGSIGYRNWIGLVNEFTDKKPKRIPALVVSRFWNDDYRLHHEGWRLRLWAFGYDMDNMKPRRWCESMLPLFFPKQERRRAVEDAARKLVDAAELCLLNLRGALKDAWFAERDPRRKTFRPEHLQAAFWQETEVLFYARLQTLIDATDADKACEAVYAAWHADLMDYTQRAFDYWVDYNQITAQSHPRRIAAARRNLRRANYRKELKKLLELTDEGMRGNPAAA